MNMATHVITRMDNALPPPGPTREDEIDLPTLVSTLTDRKWLILAGTLAFAAISIAYVLLATPQYEANAVVQVESRPPMLPGLNANASAPAPAAVDTPAATETQLLTSRRVLGAAMDDLNLDIAAEPVRFPLIGGIVARAQQRAEPGRLSSPWFGLDSYGWGGERIKVARLEVPQGLIDVPLRLVANGGGRYTLFDPNGQTLAQGRVGQAVAAGEDVRIQVDALVANPGMRFDVTRLNPMTIMADLKRDIAVSEQGRNSGIISVAYASPDPVLAKEILDRITQTYVTQNVARNSAEAAKRLKFVTEQLPKVRRELAEAQAALNRFQSRTGTMDVGLQNRSLLDQTVALDSNIQQLQIQLADAASRFTPAHPTYAALQQQINKFQGQKASLQGRINQLPDTQQGLFRLSRDVEVTNQTYASLLDQQQQLSIARESAIGTARVIDPADVDLDNPTWPKPLLIVAAGTAIGALAMCAFVLVRRMFKRGVEDPVDIELLGLPVYASIPFSEKGRQIAMLPGRSRRDGRHRLLALRAPTDLAMEALRTLRTSLHFARMEMKNNVLMIAAPSPGVGKTFVCANLAVTIAQAGQRVLLIDADMRRGTLHRAVGVRSDRGLSDLICGHLQAEEAIHEVPGTANLSFISRGSVPPNPSELLMHPNFARLLHNVGKEYDVVVIDTPPVLAVTDAAVIGHHAGTCLMVVRWGLNQQREIVLAKQRLEQNGVDVRGAIFNAVQKQGAGQYAYSYYDYQTVHNA